MSMSSVLSALRSAGRQKLSASIVAMARPVTGSHLLRIDEYSRISKMLATGKATRSDTFTVGGHDWRLLCYPNGSIEKHKGSVSMFLQHASHPKTGDATAKYEMGILVDGTSKPLNRKTMEEYRFSEDGDNWGWRDFIKHEDLDAEKHLILKDDCLTILCDVTVTEIEVTVPEPIITAPPFLLSGKLAEAIWNKQTPDLKIKVGGETIAAHRWVLEGQSHVFKADLSTTAGAGADTSQPQLLRVDDMDADVFKAVLQFLYTNSPPETKLLESATTAGRLLVAADRYELQNLKLICEEALCRHIDLSSVAAALVLAEQHDCSLLRAACMQFLSSPGNLEAFMAGEGFQQVKRGCPSALLDILLNKMMARQEHAIIG